MRLYRADKPKRARASSRQRIVGAAASVVILCAVAVAGYSMQSGREGENSQPQQSAQPMTGWSNQQAAGAIIRSQTNVVLVDVRVWDKNGRAVSDLRQEDLRVFDDGKLQKITSFSLENVERLAVASGESGPPPTLDLGKLPAGVAPLEALQDHRLMVFFFDMTSIHPEDLMRAVKGATDFVDSRMTPADLVAIVTYTSSLRILQDFTNDRDALDGVLHGIRTGESASLSVAGTEGEAGTTNASGEEVVNQDVSAAFTPDETEFNIFNTDEKLAAIESLARMLRDVPGRKSVIHFTSGVERTGIENQAQLRATVDAANRANVSLYTLDARGLAALPPGGDASSASPAGTALYTGQAVRSQLSSLQGSRETLATLATDTGGRSFFDLNDFAPAFREVQEDNSSYYLLGYTPSNTRSDGRYRRIRVELTRPGLTVRARPGYYAPKGFRQFTREDKELQLQQAMDLDAPFVDLPLAVEASYFLRPDKRYYVVLAAKIPGSALSFLRKSNTRQTEFDFAWRATDASGRTVASLRDTLPVKLSEQDYEQVMSGTVLYEGGMEMGPGKYTLKVVVRENQSGTLGTFEQPMDLPPVGDSSLALSSVIVSNQMRGALENPGTGKPGKEKEQENPLQLGTRSILPSVTRVFRTSQTLYVYLESYSGRTASRGGLRGGEQSNAGGPATPAFPPSAALVFFRGGAKISEAGPFAGKVESSSQNKTTYLVEIPLEKFPPGRYWMQVNVLDPAAAHVAFARLPLAIMRPPAKPPGQVAPAERESKPSGGKLGG
jgi:VWFA-related protein